jgi:hypothetical protein
MEGTPFRVVREFVDLLEQVEGAHFMEIITQLVARAPVDVLPNHPEDLARAAIRVLVEHTDGRPKSPSAKTAAADILVSRALSKRCRKSNELGWQQMAKVPSPLGNQGLSENTVGDDEGETTESKPKDKYTEDEELLLDITEKMEDDESVLEDIGEIEDEGLFD